jgi:hypothetical protein
MVVTAREENHAELTLEGADALGDGLLGDAQLVGCALELSFRRDREEGSYRVEVHPTTVVTQRTVVARRSIGCYLPRCQRRLKLDPAGAGESGPSPAGS